MPLMPVLQAGLFDMYSGQVLHQVPLLLEQNSTSLTARSIASTQPQAVPRLAAGGQGCWDCTGRVLYTQGILQYSQPDAGSTCEESTASLAAIDFGSWHGRRQRWGGSTAGSSSNSSGEGSSAGQAATPGAAADTGRIESEEGLAAGEVGGSRSQDSSRGRYKWQGRAHMGQGGQVLHRELHCSATPTAIAAAGSCGALLIGTQTGSVLWLE
jgi:hypothetical protein